MGDFTWVSFYFREDIGSNSMIEEVRDKAPDNLVEHIKFHDEKSDLGLKYDEDLGCVYWNSKQLDPNELEQVILKWTKNIGGSTKVVFICQGDNTEFSGSVKTLIFTGRTSRMVEFRKGHLDFNNENRPRLFAYGQFDYDPDRERDHFDELESVYGERPYCNWY